MKLTVKRIVYLLIVISVITATVVTPVAAANKADVLAELKKTIIAHYVDMSTDKVVAKTPHIQIMAEHSIRDFNFTEAEGDLFVEWIKACAAYVNVDKGPSGHSYTPAEREFVIAHIQKVADVLNLRIAFEPKARPVHKGDIIFKVYDKDELIFIYDGDVVKRTDEVK